MGLSHNSDTAFPPRQLALREKIAIDPVSPDVPSLEFLGCPGAVALVKFQEGNESTRAGNTSSIGVVVVVGKRWKDKLPNQTYQGVLLRFDHVNSQSRPLLQKAVRYHPRSTP